MKTRDIVFYTTLAVAALAMAGCEKSNDMPQESGPGLPAEIRFAPAIVPLTRATGTAFEEGDTVGIYCVESTDDPAAAIVGERYIDNKQLTMTAGTLTGTTPCFWPTEYTGLSDFYAYFPYNEKGLSDDKQSYEISVALDQSDDEAFRTSDHMLARAQNTARTEKAIPLDFKRLMSLLDFVLLPGTGYDDVDGILAAEVQVMNMAQVANVDFVTGEVSSPAIKANITPHGSFRASDGKAVGVEAIVPPQHIDARSYLFNVRIGERNFRCTTDKELTFEAGRRYTFTLTINRAAAGGEVALSPTIEDWTPGTASSEETVEVDPDLDAKVVRDIDGNEYAIVRIGTQQWTGANLRTTHYNDGTPITLLEDQEAWAQCENSEEAAYCLYDNDATNSELYGMLYNWHAANTGKLCPEGWHIPSQAEWQQLAQYVLDADMAAVGSNGEVDETAIAKALAMDYPDDELMWNLPSMIEGDPQPTWPGIDKSKNNATKFSGIPIGFRSYSFNPADGGVQWDHASYSAGWWSSTQGVMGEGYCAVVRMWSDNQRFATDSNFIGGVGLTVRCLQD